MTRLNLLFHKGNGSVYDSVLLFVEDLSWESIRGLLQTRVLVRAYIVLLLRTSLRVLLNRLRVFRTTLLRICWLFILILPLSFKLKGIRELLCAERGMGSSPLTGMDIRTASSLILPVRTCFTAVRMEVAVVLYKLGYIALVSLKIVSVL